VGKYELHKVRKSFATMHHDAGVSARTLQKRLGHSVKRSSHWRSDMSREAPPKYKNHMLHLRYWGTAWNTAQFVVGLSSAALAAVVAANAKANFLDTQQAVWMAAISAGLMFITTAFNPGKKGAAYQVASRHINKEILRYESDPSRAEKTLGDASAEAEDILKESK
jgi:hypothetical protein